MIRKTQRALARVRRATSPQGQVPYPLLTRAFASLWKSLKPLVPIQAESGHKAIISLLIVVIPLWLFGTRATQQLRDSLLYLHGAKTGTDMFHPHHIAFTPAIRWVSSLLGTICDSCDTILAAQLHNIFWATVSILCLFFILKYICRSHWFALCGAMFLLVTRGFWELSTQSTVYVPALATLALLTATMLQSPWTRTRTVCLSLLLALSVLYHQANILFCVPLLLYSAVKWKLSGFKRATVIILPAGVLVFGCYAGVFLSDNSWSTQGFIDFTLTYTHHVSVGGQLSPSPSQWGTAQNLSLAGMHAMAESSLWNLVIMPKRLLNVALPSTAVLLGIVLFWHLRALVLSRATSSLRTFLLAWVLIYSGFFLWWLPGYQHPFLSAIFPMLILAFWMLHELSLQYRLRPALLYSAMLAAILFVGAINLWKQVLPLHHEKTSAYLVATELQSRIPNNCQIMTTTSIWNHLRFYFDRDNVIQAKHPLAYFDIQQTLPDRYHLPATACMAIDARLTSPDYIVRNDDRIGYRNPSGWFGFLGWLFDFEYRADDTLTSCRSFRTVRLTDGTLYLLLLPQRIQVTGIRDFFDTLDHDIAVHPKLQQMPFQAWLDEHSHQFPQSVASF